MTVHDNDTFDRFAERFARIEPLVADRPATGARRSSRSPGAPAALATATVVVVAAIVLGGVLLGGRFGPPGPASITGTMPPASSDLPSAGPVALVPLDPVDPPAELPPPCLSHTTVFDRLITTPAEDAANSRTVLIGRVSGVGGGQWNTATGRPPGHDHPDGFSAFRLVRVEVESVVRGVPAPAAITVWILGGRIGCHQFSVGDFRAEIAIGERYILFLRDAAPRTGLTSVVEAWQMWSIDGRSVDTTFAPDLPLEEVLDQMRGGPTPSR
jgi:hypothetical protein